MVPQLFHNVHLTVRRASVLCASRAFSCQPFLAKIAPPFPRTKFPLIPPVSAPFAPIPYFSPDMHKPRFLLLGVALAFAAGWALQAAGQPAVLCRTAAVAVLMAFWWISEATNIYFTGMLPLMLFPLLGIMGAGELAPFYLKEIIFLFIGGFILGFALERWNLHHRIALSIILAVGVSPARLLAGFMLAGWFLSMWILNTAAATILLPAALAVLDQMPIQNKAGRHPLTIPLLLGVAFSCSIGGVATLIGTMPNLVLADFYAQYFEGAEELSFARWFAFGFPLSAVMLLITWLILRVLWLREDMPSANMEQIRRQYQALGPMRYAERVMTVAMGLTIIAWFTLSDIPFGSFTMPGWATMLGLEGYVRESTVALIAVGVLFLWPAREGQVAGLVRWADVQRVPLGVLFLFGGGFALAAGMEQSGLSSWIATHMLSLQHLPLFGIILILCLFTTFFTELTSNTATTMLMLTLLLPMCSGLNMHPLWLMLPVTLSASFAFMLPVATPPNTIVFASERIPMRAMVRTGIWLNLAGVLLILLMTRLWAGTVFSL